jgi:hypothetical protein
MLSRRSWKGNHVLHSPVPVCSSPCSYRTTLHRHNTPGGLVTTASEASGNVHSVVVLAATNRLEDLDEAVMRRFESKVQYAFATSHVAHTAVRLKVLKILLLVNPFMFHNRCTWGHQSRTRA